MAICEANFVAGGKSAKLGEAMTLRNSHLFNRLAFLSAALCFVY
jgi:hypothetical protein